MNVVDATEEEKLAEAKCQVAAAAWRRRSDSSQSEAQRAELKCSMYESLDDATGAAEKACESKKTARNVPGWTINGAGGNSSFDNKRWVCCSEKVLSQILEFNSKT
jgi:hypothetical protein